MKQTKKELLGICLVLVLLAFLIPATPVNTANASSNGIAGLWHLDEKSGTKAYDSSGKGNHGTILPAILPPTRVTGKFGNALNFDGTDDYVEVPDSASLRPSHFTIEAWINPDTQPRWARVLEKYWDAGTGARTFPYLSYSLVIREDAPLGSISLLIGDGINLYKLTSVGGAIPNNVWTHVAATYDGSNMRLYINGAEDSNSPIGVTTTVAYSADPLYIGARVDPLYPVYFDGVIDEVRVWDAALSATQIAQSYALGTPQPPGGATAVWLSQARLSGGQFVIFTSSFEGLRNVQNNTVIYIMPHPEGSVTIDHIEVYKAFPLGTATWTQTDITETSIKGTLNKTGIVKTVYLWLYLDTAERVLVTARFQWFLI